MGKPWPWVMTLRLWGEEDGGTAGRGQDYSFIVRSNLQTLQIRFCLQGLEKTWRASDIIKGTVKIEIGRNVDETINQMVE